MSRNRHQNHIVAVVVFAVVAMASLSSCSPSKGNHPGHEFFPDMFHSIAYEANIHDYYYYNTWGNEVEYRKYATPREPVKGTIPRGFAGASSAADYKDKAAYFQNTPVNGFVPYYYEDTEEERTRASAEILENPFPITAEGLSRGEDLYDIFCGICHGDNGDGAGYLVRDDGGVYPAQPANFLLPEFVEASEGRYYHSIMFGKNVMGGYADKLSYEERWQVIHYIRSLQAKELGLVYDPTGNTLNNSGIPEVEFEASMEVDMEQQADGESEDHSTDVHDSDDH